MCSQCARPCAAPEVISAKTHYDGTKADIWSCGVMLYVMLFCEYPFERPEDEQDNRGFQKVGSCPLCSPLICVSGMGTSTSTCEERSDGCAGAPFHVVSSEPVMAAGRWSSPAGASAVQHSFDVGLNVCLIWHPTCAGAGPDHAVRLPAAQVPLHQRRVPGPATAHPGRQPGRAPHHRPDPAASLVRAGPPRERRDSRPAILACCRLLQASSCKERRL